MKFPAQMSLVEKKKSGAEGKKKCWSSTRLVPEEEEWKPFLMFFFIRCIISDLPTAETD